MNLSLIVINPVHNLIVKSAIMNISLIVMSQVDHIKVKLLKR